ncbi:hypothetical protein DID88_010357 [Monilinia fructigena]|uniref:Major facilitator superfamily (MFS) profile domain-containing protein n=1 Tax=Monilinia fructigena TaxID=38457 RepID=A0A395INY0_9HELO|nr:hypothetical protein DID88_010357 [Monilinia fructigena]
MSTNPPDTSADLGSGDDVPDTIAPPPRPLTPTDADGEITQQLRLPEPSSIVSWDSDSDQLNPMNWSSTQRWANTAVISAMTFSTPLASTMFAPGVPLVMDEFRSTNRILETLVVSVFVLGFAMGPLVAAPMSELYGRCVGAAPTALGGASIGDMFSRDRKRSGHGNLGMGPLAGPIVGPIVGGFLAEGAGWRWAFWLEAIIAGLTLVLGSFLLQETYPVVILEKKTRRIIKETGDTSKVSALYHKDSPLQYFTYAIIRPLKMRNGGIAEPEYRLPALMLTSPLIAIALFVYGWTAELKIHWIVPIIGTSFFGIGLIPAFLSINMYLVDGFPTYAASAIAATKVFQSIGGAFLPLAGPPLYAALGWVGGIRCWGITCLPTYLVTKPWPLP